MFSGWVSLGIGLSAAFMAFVAEMLTRLYKSEIGLPRGQGIRGGPSRNAGVGIPGLGPGPSPGPPQGDPMMAWAAENQYNWHI